jgi:MFS family permease
MRELFQNSGFRRLWASLVALSLGDALMQMALLELFHRHHYDERVETAKMLFAVAVPGLLFGPVAMAYLDRWQRRTVLLVSDAFRALVAAGIVAWLWLLTGRMEERHLLVVYTLIFAIGTVATFYLPARVALVPNLVPTDRLMQANTLFTTSIAVAAIGGRALGGFVAEVCGPMSGMVANAGAYVLSVVCLLRIKMPPHATSHAANGWTELRTGLAYLWHHALALRLVAVAGAFAFVGGLLLVELVGYATDTLHLGTGGVGYLIGAGGAGAAIGMAICARGPKWVRADWLTPVQLTLVGAALVALGLTKQVWVAVPLVVVVGASAVMAAIHVDAKLQERVEETRRGAVFAARGMLTSLTTVVAFWLQFGTVWFRKTDAPVVMWWLGLGTMAAGLLTLRMQVSQSRR